MIRIIGIGFPGSALAAVGLLVWGFAGQSRPVTAREERKPASRTLSAERLDDRIIVRIDDRTFTCYRFGAGQKYPYLFPVNGPLSGRSVTTESSLPWPHHRSLFFGCDKVNGGNYWQEGNERGQIVSRGPKVEGNGPGSIRIVDSCDWLQPGQSPIMKDRREITIEAPSSDLRTIDFSITLSSLADVKIERSNHALFSTRVEPELSARGGGTLVNAEGMVSEKGTFGIPSAWCDFSGTRCGVTEGIAIFDSPANRWFPCKWFTRDYGFMSPTPMEWLGTEGYTLAKGEHLQLRYRVVVHAGDATKAGLHELFRAWRALAGNEVR